MATISRKCEGSLEKARNNPRGLKFAELQKLAECFGYEHSRTSGSHHIYKHVDVKAVLNMQPDGRDAKAYQVKQLLDQVDELGLTL
ncbi:MAG: type II toxin-antitoxin system HicA family toxin [Gemmatimonadales bacterium]